LMGDRNDQENRFVIGSDSCMRLCDENHVGLLIFAAPGS
jgi:hypothetical protein